MDNTLTDTHRAKAASSQVSHPKSCPSLFAPWDALHAAVGKLGILILSTFLILALSPFNNVIFFRI